MFTEQLIRHNQARHQELLREATQNQAEREMTQGSKGSSVVSEALARTGDLLVAAGVGLQRRYRHMEQGVNMTDYAKNRRLGRAL